ncbi:MAG: hypothetical protein ABI068_12395 [Ktedonobacterales bacterium]
MASLQAFLQDRHTLNLLSIVIGIFAGLYGFYELLGRPGGVLRQLLVAVPSGILAGASLLLADNLTHQLYSHSFQALVQFPLTSTTLALIGFFPSFLIPIAAPTTFRRGSASQRYTPSWFETALFVVIITASGVLGYVVSLEAIQARINPFHWHLTLPAVVAVAAVLSLCLAIAGAWGMRQQAHGEDDDTGNSISGWGCAVLLVLYLLVFGVGIVALIAFIQLFGWGILLYSVISGVGVQLLYGVQFLVDRMKPRQLGYFALLLFAIAAAIQLYLALI